MVLKLLYLFIMCRWISVDLCLLMFIINSTFGCKLYAVSKYGSIFYASEDGGGGRHWTKLDINGYDRTIISLVGDGTNIYVASGSGIFISDNGGHTWIVKNKAIDGTKINNILRVLKFNDGIYAGSEKELFVSKDKGVSWKKIAEGNFAHLYAHKNILFRQYWKYHHLEDDYLNDNLVYSHSTESTFDGKTWHTLSWDNVSFPLYIRNNGRLYVAVSAHNGDDCDGIAISYDEGKTWLHKSYAGCEYPSSIKHITGTNNAVFVASSKGLMVSYDIGNSWTRKGDRDGLVAQDIQTVFATNHKVYVVTTSGLHASEDNGHSGTRLWDEDSIKYLIFQKCVPCGIYCGLSGGWLSFTHNQGITWENKQIIDDADTRVSSALLTENEIYMGTDSGGLYVSEDSGQTWISKIKLGSYDFGSIRAITANNDDVCVAHYYGLSCSSDSGFTWNQTLSSETLSSRLKLDINSVYINGQNICAVSSDYAIFSSDNGKTWNYATLPQELYSTIVLNNKIYGIYYDIIDLNMKHKNVQPSIYISEECGKLWTNHTIGNAARSDDTRLNFKDDLIVRGSIIYATVLKNTIYESKDGGKTWVSLDKNFTAITSIFVGNDRIYVGDYHAPFRPTGVLFISDDRGKTWTNKSIADGLGKYQGDYIYAIFGSACPISNKNVSLIITNINYDATSPFLSWYLILICVTLPLIFVAFLSLAINVGIRRLKIFLTLRRPRIDISNLTPISKLGCGQFGEVWLANYKIMKDQSINVALKLSKHTQVETSVMRLASAECFFQETIALNILRHKNIVLSYGVCTNFKDESGNTTSALVLEYLNGGSAIEYIRSERIHLRHKDLLQIFLDICKAGRHLSNLGVVHRDIAARNVLIQKNTQNGRPIVAKLTDFGLAKDVGGKSGLYTMTNPDRAMFHMRYTAPEGFRGCFSSQSDVWSFGVFVWEVYMLRSENALDHGNSPVPYSQFSTKEEILREITSNRLLDRPPSTPDDINDIMNSCWNLETTSRPTFDQLVKIFISRRVSRNCSAQEIVDNSNFELVECHSGADISISSMPNQECQSEYDYGKPNETQFFTK